MMVDRDQSIRRIEIVAAALVVVTSGFLGGFGARSIVIGDWVIGVAFLAIGIISVLLSLSVRPSQHQKASTAMLIILILKAGFGVLAVTSTLLIVSGQDLIAIWSGFPPASRQVARLIALAVVVGQGIVLLLVTLTLRQAIIPQLRREIELRMRDLSEQQSALIAQLREAAIQEERNRLARDLHDTIKQQLFSINVAAATAQSLLHHNPEAIVQHLQHVRDLSQAAMAEMKALLTQLRPQPLATVGLIEAIRDQLEALRFRAEVTTELHYDVLPDEGRLPLGAQETIFRVVQEALSNVARHARARHTQVALTCETTNGSEVLHVCITDDGQGFDPATTPSGMGLTNMRTRIEAIGGTLAVRSTPNAGTTVCFRIPLLELEADKEKERRMKEENLQHVYVAGGLTALTGTAFVLALFPLLIAITGSGLSYLASFGIVGAIAGVPLAFATWNWRRRTLKHDPDSIWRKVLRSYDIMTAIFLMVLLGWFAFSLRSIAIGLIIAVALVVAIVSLVRLYRVLDARLTEWATMPALRTQLREYYFLLGFMVVFQVLVYSGLFGPIQAVTLFHDKLDQRWFISFLALGYPLLIPLGMLNIFLTRRQIRRLEALEQPVAEPVGDAQVRRLRMIARGLTLVYHALCVAIGWFIWMNIPPVAIAMGVIALVLLAIKWRVERTLTARVGEWSTFQAQQSAMALYLTFLLTNIAGILGGFLGTAMAWSGLDTSNTAFDNGAGMLPTIAPWTIFGFGTWWLGTWIYLSMQVIISWQRIRALAQRK
ncbi:sensor histidine kinase [Chloroflexus sp. MS-G]|uniref:sensor histidine kinase n=1 Tax=Chloroflexus sp. MS-G TaxID=1521187 RepID=UPI000AA3E10B|nr:sensor histidine kinase [Chloroflexus sp. MS-G]